MLPMDKIFLHKVLIPRYHTRWRQGDNFYEILPVEQWLSENAGKGNWMYFGDDVLQSRFGFKDPNIALTFKLTWGGE